jgi:hypothetical protein
MLLTGPAASLFAIIVAEALVIFIELALSLGLASVRRGQEAQGLREDESGARILR